MNIEIALPKKMVEPLFTPHRYKVFKGGRGSAKSWSVARALCALGRSKRLRILCTREVQKSIQDSSYKLLSDQIELLGMGDHYDVLKSEIRGQNGTEFLFRGLGNMTAESIKSFEGVDIVWVEEAHTVSERSWELLIPTIRKPKSEIWVTYNPDQNTDPVDVRFVQSSPPDCVVTTINWDDNPWFPEVLKQEKDYLFKVDPEAAAHVWGGAYRRMNDAQVLRGRWRVESFDPMPHWNGPYYGADWGFATDPTALTVSWIDGRTLYVEHEAYQIGCEIDHLPALFDSVPGVRSHLTRADNARPETISYMIRQGFNMMAAEKWAGSVEDGVEWLRSFESIVIHPRCTHTAEEARLWSYKTDKLTGDVLPALLDRHNHCWDAIRYALSPLILGFARQLPQKEAEPEEFFGRPHSEGWMA